jgi:hypothetical protein
VLAVMFHAVALSMVASKSLAKRLLRQNRAKARSTTRRRGFGLKVPLLWDRRPDPHGGSQVSAGKSQVQNVSGTLVRKAPIGKLAVHDSRYC